MMNLQQLVAGLAPSSATEPLEITGLALHTHHIQPGEAFIAYKGQQVDGRNFIKEAIAKGAKAVLCEAEDLPSFSLPSSEVPIIPVHNLALQLDKLAKRFYGEPSSEMEIIGITGTNGKTTTSYLLAQALSRLGIPTAILGTIGCGFVNNLNETTLTTPDAISLQKYLSSLKQEGAKAVAMEVSSHGLELNRVKNIHFQSAMFTNLTQDHLDFHATMEAYGRAKQKLFHNFDISRAIINADCPYFEKILTATSKDIPTILYSIGELPKISYKRKSLGFIHASSIILDQKGITAEIRSPWGTGILRSPLVGEFNLSNLLGVLAELCLRDIPLKDALFALSFANAAPGRMQRLGGVREPQVIIDYAHTPDALQNALKAARLHCRRRLWCIFGCGGSRDKDKRPKMGKVAAELADKIIITNDNPRNEQPHKIIEDILQGIDQSFGDKITIIEDRQMAIEYALHQGLAIDTIVIAGKGHENYQIIGSEKIPFNDMECVKKLLKEDNINETVNLR